MAVKKAKRGGGQKGQEKWRSRRPRVVAVKKAKGMAARRPKGVAVMKATSGGGQEGHEGWRSRSPRGVAVKKAKRGQHTKELKRYFLNRQ